MDAVSTTDLARQAMALVLLVGAPVLGVGLIVALVVSILQAATQLHDQTLSLVPRIAAMLLALVVLMPWMIARIVEFGREMFGSLP